MPLGRDLTSKNERGHAAESYTARIGGAGGFWGDRVLEPVELLKHEKLDYIMFDYLAELTLSIMAKQRARNSETGWATDLVDWLVLQGMPFRKAHHVVGKLIALAEAKKKRLDQLTPTQLKQVDKKFTKDALKVFDLKTAMANRTVIGAPGKAELKRRLAYWNKFLRH